MRFLTSQYRKTLWENTKKILHRMYNVSDISKVYMLGSFLSTKERPADVDLIVFVKTKESVNEAWSVDVVFVPDNEYGEEILKDASAWVKEKYGKEGDVICLDINNLNDVT